MVIDSVVVVFATIASMFPGKVTHHGCVTNYGSIVEEHIDAPI